MKDADRVQLLLGGAAPVESLPSSTGASVTVGFAPLTRSDCKSWDKHVQPVIHRDYPDRADADWRWSRLWLLTRLSTSNRKVQGWAMYLRDAENVRKMTIGLMLAVTPYPHLVDKGKRSAFLWWLTTIPEELIVAEGIPVPKLVGASILDYGLVEAFRDEFQGRVGLHAAPEGGEGLRKFYQSRHMIPVSSAVSIPGLHGVFVNNDGGYFFYQPNESFDAYADLSAWRPVDE